MSNNKNTSDNTVRASWLARVLDSPKWSFISIPILSIILSIIAASILLLILGKNPGTAFKAFLQGSGFLPKPKYGGGSGQLTDLFGFLNEFAPMLLASLGFIVGMKAGLFNIGISGQMMAAGFIACVLVGYSDLNAWAAKPLVILIGIAVGGAIGAFVGFLKYKFNIHEVVSTIMINYIISYLCGFGINGFFADPLTRSMKKSGSASRLTWTNVQIAGQKCDIPLGIVIAIIAAIIVWIIFDRTVFGFELKAVGSNRRNAEYIGIRVSRRIVQSMMISGILAGLAGVTYYMGYYNTMQPKDLASMGYDSIAVALLGNIHPIGAIFSSLLITIFYYGTSYMSSAVGVAKEIASLITGILLLFSACGGYMKYLAHRRVEKAADIQLEKERAKRAAQSRQGNDSSPEDPEKGKEEQ